MKKIFLLIIVTTAIISSCKKENVEYHPYQSTPPDILLFSSSSNFHFSYGERIKTYTINAAAGGNFITEKGTVVTVPPSAFVTQNGNLISGNVQVEFMDVYTKSQMLMTGKHTGQYFGTPLKSGGEFFIRVKQNGGSLLMATGKSISVEQPLQPGEQPDPLMDAFVEFVDTAGQGGWINNFSDSVQSSPTGYLYSLYQFSMPADSGTWCNSDNSIYFSSYTQTTFTAACSSPGFSFVEVFLLFDNVNSMVHVYPGQTGYPYNFAPLGMTGTLVAVGSKDGDLYSSFTPFTITANGTLNFGMTKTTLDDFKSQLNTLN